MPGRTETEYCHVCGRQTAYDDLGTVRRCCVCGSLQQNGSYTAGDE